jgi:hypothetical protein
MAAAFNPCRNSDDPASRPSDIGCRPNASKEWTPAALALRNLKSPPPHQLPLACHRQGHLVVATIASQGVPHRYTAFLPDAH